MSDYFRGLIEPARARYLRKLQLIGLKEVNDLYSETNDRKLIDNMTLWPPVEHGHIFSYFIARPRLYTLEQLLAWKQLDAYNYFQSGYVRTVLAWKVSNICLLKAIVNPSQETPTNVHRCWIAVKRDGTVTSAHCTCMAG